MRAFISNLIKFNGPLSLSSFMSEALYNPKYGYYTNQDKNRLPFGKEGDFITSPEISQVFGELIGAYLINLWQTSYPNKEVYFVEMGAGKGTLMKDILNIAKKIPNLLEKFQINIIEISSKLKEVQQENLRDYKIKWWSSFPEFYQENKDKPIFFISNELFDCFTIDQYLKKDNFWLEKIITLDKNHNLRFALGSKNKILSDKINCLIGHDVDDESIFEYSLGADNFMLDLSSAIKNSGGIAINIDYGYKDNKFDNTLQAIKNHKFTNVLENIGQSDITSHVNFFRLANIAKNKGLKTYLTNQREFLLSLGVEIRRKTLLEKQTNKQQDNINSSIDRLINKDEMGELFKVLIIENYTD